MHTRFPRIILGYLALCWGVSCSNGTPDIAPGDNDDTRLVEPQTVLDSRCGLDFRWIDPATVGEVVEMEVGPRWNLRELEGIAALLDTLTQTTRVPQYGAQLHYLRYSTQDRGQAQEATAMVIVPEVEEEDAVLPVLTFLHPTTGLNDRCAPSHLLREGETAGVLNALTMGVYASFGYIVVAPDYLGQKSSGEPSSSLHPYYVGEPAALATLDGIKAALSWLEDQESHPTAGPVVLWGASQGAHVGMFTARYHPHYAPHVDLVGAVHSVGSSAYAQHLARRTRALTDGTATATLFYVAAADWYRVPEGVSGILRAPWAEQVPEIVAQECAPKTLETVASVEEFFHENLLAAVQGEALQDYGPWDCFARESSLGTSSLPATTIPQLFIHGAQDPIALVDIETPALDELCGAGPPMGRLICAEADHEEGFLWSIEDALDFLDERLEGVPFQAPACDAMWRSECSGRPTD